MSFFLYLSLTLHFFLSLPVSFSLSFCLSVPGCLPPSHTHTLSLSLLLSLSVTLSIYLSLSISLSVFVSVSFRFMSGFILLSTKYNIIFHGIHLKMAKIMVFLPIDPLYRLSPLCEQYLCSPFGINVVSFLTDFTRYPHRNLYRTRNTPRQFQC